MDAKLVVIGGKANKRQVSVKLPTIIGRSRQADLTVAHPMISRKHCELCEVDGLLMIRDLGSLNGLYVGGRQVSEAALHPNSEFSVGPLTFRVEYEYVGQVAPAPEASTTNEKLKRAGPGSGGEVAELQLGDHRLGPDQPEEAAAGEEELPVHEEPASDEAEPGPSDTHPTIAPPNGQLPSPSSWGRDTVRQVEEEQAAEPLSPPPPVPPPQVPVEGAAPSEQKQMGDAGQAQGPPEPEAPGGAQPPVAPPQAAEQPAANRQPAIDDETADDMPDLSLPAQPYPDESPQAKPADKDLDDFLKGLE